MALLQYQRENLNFLSEEILRLQECLSKYERSGDGKAPQGLYPGYIIFFVQSALMIAGSRAIYIWQQGVPPHMTMVKKALVLMNFAYENFERQCGVHVLLLNLERERRYIRTVHTNMGCLHSSDGIASLLKKKKRTSDNSNSGPNNEEENAVQSTAANAPTIFTFDQLAAATENFKADNLVGEGGFGRVYKGKLEDFDQIVAVKRQDRKGDQGLDEFSNELSTLSLLDHPNLVKLIGYCSEEHEKLLVYEFMPLGSLDKHLYGAHPNKKQLDWKSRLKIAADAARGLAYLHDRAKPPIVHRDFKTSNILLDEDLNVKLSDFGLAKEGPVGDQTHVLAPVTGTYGYCAPDYRNTGRLTFKSDVYSFGVVLLELITGRKALDGTRPIGEVDLVSWALRLFKKKKKFRDMVDPALEGRYPLDGLYYALSICVDCLNEKADSRPVAANVVRALDILVSQNNDPQKDSHGAGPSGVKKGDEGEG